MSFNMNTGEHEVRQKPSHDSFGVKGTKLTYRVGKASVEDPNIQTQTIRLGLICCCDKRHMSSVGASRRTSNIFSRLCCGGVSGKRMGNGFLETRVPVRLPGKSSEM